MKHLISLLTLGLILGLSSCKKAEEVEEKTEAEVEAKDAVLGPVVWVAQDDDSKLFLIGTVPYLKDNAEWETLAITGAADEASTYFFEYDPSDNAAMAASMLTQELGFYLDGTTLADRLSEEDKVALANISEASKIPYGSIINFQPWLGAMVLGGSAAQNEELNGDDLFIKDMLRKARIERKTVSYLTTPESRVRALAALPEDIQIRFFNRTVFRYNALGEKMVATAEAWQNGQISELKSDSVNLHSQLPEREYEDYIKARNEEWIDQLDNFMQGTGDGVLFVSMPYLLTDEVNLQLMLIDRKYNVKRYYGVE